MTNAINTNFIFQIHTIYPRVICKMDEKNKMKEKQQKKDCPSEDAWVTVIIVMLVCATFLWATRMWVDASMASNIMQAQLLRGSEIDPNDDSVFFHN